MAFFKKSEKYTDDRVTTSVNSEKLNKYFSKLPKAGKGFAYVNLNINKFNQINNAFGYDTGSIVLNNIVDILEKNISDDELVSRIVGDEFVLFLKFENQQSFSERLQKIIDILQNIEVTNGSIVFDYNCSYCCGVYEIQGNESSFDEVSSMANITYRSAKRQQLTYLFYDRSMQEDITLIRNLLPLTKQALSKRQIVPYFQSNYDLKTKDIIGAEIFSRWNHPEFGLIKPNDFINVFEHSGDILDLDLYMLEEACKLIVKWINAECVPIPLALNISKFNLYQVNFIDKVINIINLYKIPTCLIIIEINANALLENQEKAFEIMTQFHEKGFTLSVDNFGQNHVFVDILYKFPIDILNIDSSFIKDAQQFDKMNKVLFFIISLARQLGISVSAKGVENKKQEDFLTRMKCDYVQGFLYSDTQPLGEFEELAF